ncbi:roadblock/LC7 domain-containing protein [Streptomyces sp. NPDC056549]|uniref:roadblock/LC7 domain-containing protein n=1 Tax=Streptomyces sp. NPDC056549 TaxID=3345864 RepID=UPI00367AD6B1
MKGEEKAMQHATADTFDLSPQLNTLVGDGVICALLFSADGMPLAASDGLSREATERSCAAFSGMYSLQRGFAEFCQTDPNTLRPRAQMIDFVSHTVLLLAAGRNSGLAISVEGQVFSPSAQLALKKGLKLITALEPVLAARDRPTQRA